MGSSDAVQCIPSSSAPCCVPAERVGGAGAARAPPRPHPRRPPPTHRPRPRGRVGGHETAAHRWRIGSAMT